MVQVIDSTPVHHELTWAAILAAHEQRPSTSWANQVEEAEASAGQKPTGGANLVAGADAAGASYDPQPLPSEAVHHKEAKATLASAGQQPSGVRARLVGEAKASLHLQGWANLGLLGKPWYAQPSARDVLRTSHQDGKAFPQRQEVQQLQDAGLSKLMVGLHIPATVDPTSMPQTNVKTLNSSSQHKRALDRDYRTVCRMMARLTISPKPDATGKTKAPPAFPPSNAASFSFHAPPAQPAFPHSSTSSSFAVGGVRPQYGHGKEGWKVWSRPQRRENGRPYNRPYRQMRGQENYTKPLHQAYYKTRHPIKKDRSPRRHYPVDRYYPINFPEPPAPKPAFPHRRECYRGNNRPYRQMRGQQNYTKPPRQAYYKTKHSIKNDRSARRRYTVDTRSPLDRPSATVNRPVLTAANFVFKPPPTFDTVLNNPAVLKSIFPRRQETWMSTKPFMWS